MIETISSCLNFFLFRDVPEEIRASSMLPRKNLRNPPVGWIPSLAGSFGTGDFTCETWEPFLVPDIWGYIYIYVYMYIYGAIMDN